MSASSNTYFIGLSREKMCNSYNLKNIVHELDDSSVPNILLFNLTKYC